VLTHGPTEDIFDLILRWTFSTRRDGSRNFSRGSGAESPAAGSNGDLGAWGLGAKLPEANDFWRFERKTNRFGSIFNSIIYVV